MNKQQAKTFLRVYASQCLAISDHCRERMIERNVTVDDILYVIMWGEVVEVQKDEERQNWVAKVQGVDTDGNELIFIAGIDPNENSVLCITVY